MNYISNFFKDDLTVTKDSTVLSFVKGILFSVLLVFAFEISNFTPLHAKWSVTSLVLVIVFLIGMHLLGIRLISFKPLKRSELLLILAVLLLNFGLDGLFDYFVDSNNVNDSSIADDFKNVPLWASIISLAVIPALAEEVLIRGIVLRVFFRNHLFLGMIISSLIFASLHSADSLIGYLPYFYSGILFSLIYLKTKRLETAILVHFLNNFISTLFI